MSNAFKKRNQASIFDSLALTSFHTFSLSLRRLSLRRRKRLPPNPRMLEQARLAARRQDRRWLDQVIGRQNDAMCPSEPERVAFVALTRLPTDQLLYTALTEWNMFEKVKMLYARLLRERNRARKDQGIKYHTDAVADWWFVRKAEKKAKKGKKGKEVAEHEENEGYTEVDWESLGMSIPGEKEKERGILEMDMPFRGPKV